MGEYHQDLLVQHQTLIPWQLLMPIQNLNLIINSLTNNSIINKTNISNHNLTLKLSGLSFTRGCKTKTNCLLHQDLTDKFLRLLIVMMKMKMKLLLEEAKGQKWLHLVI